jgi:diacylglycerol kinase (ATP)
MPRFLNRRLINPLKYSIAGFKFAWQSEEAFRLEIFVSAVLIPVAFFLGESFSETAILLLSLTLVLITELINSAIENTIDKISLEINHLSKVVKDISSAAVFIALLNAFLIWSFFLIYK